MPIEKSPPAPEPWTGPEESAPATGTRVDENDTKVDEKDDVKWTVMVFMGADTVNGDAPLKEAAAADLAEMLAVGSGGSLNILVQVHGMDDVPRRYHIGVGPKDGVAVPVSERDPAGGRALADFVQWCITRREVGHRPYDRSMLILWGHAYDFAIGRAPTRPGTIDSLDFVELSEALKGLQARIADHYDVRGDMKLDVVGFDACDVATVEMACQLQPYAKYLLGSQIGVPIPGWPYDRVLGRLRFPVGRLMGPPEFGSFAVRRYCESYVPAHRAVSLTMLNLQRASELFARTEVLATALDLAISQGSRMRDIVTQLFSRSQTAANKPYVDLADLCLNLVRDGGDPLVAEAARALGDFLLAPLQRVVGKSCYGEGKPFVVDHSRNAGATAKLNGISIYAPHVAPINDFAAVQKLYSGFDFARDTRWDRLVHGLAGAQPLSGIGE